MASRAHDLVLRAVPAACRTPRGYRLFDDGFAYLFNSYYVAVGPRHARPQRGLITRPGARARSPPIARMSMPRCARLIEAARRARRCAKSLPILEIGLHHEQQHQELILTDILHAFAQNPIASGL